MITVEVIDKDFDIEVGAKNIVTTCADATVTATNSLSTVLGTVSAPSGGTGNIPISDSPINKSDGTLIANVPAETSYTVADSVITVEYVNGTPISITNVKATEAATIQVPNQATLQDVIDDNTATDIGNAINSAIDTDKPSDVFVVTAPNITDTALNNGITLTQRNKLYNLRPYKTGQTNAISPFDDGTLQEGRGQDWLTLDDGTPRWVEITTNLWQDRANGLDWYNVIIGAKNYDDYATEANTLNVGGYTGFRVPNIKELQTITQYADQPLGYAPFNYNQGVSGLITIVSSNSEMPVTTDVRCVILQVTAGLPTGYSFINRNKVGTSGGNSLKRAFYCRTSTQL